MQIEAYNVCIATRGVRIAFMRNSRAFVGGGCEEEDVDNRAYASLLKVHVIWFCICRGLCNKVKAKVGSTLILFPPHIFYFLMGYT